jgi:DNA-binding NarL/FixJ family response regulator
MHAGALGARRSEPASAGAGRLTRRELQVLELLAEGLGNKIIAGRIGISERTVKFHVTRIFDKLGVGSRTEAVTAGLRRGLIML